MSDQSHPQDHRHEQRAAEQGSDPEAEIDESKMSPMELLKHRQAQGELADPDSEEERRRQELLAEAELRLSSGRTPAEIEELFKRNNVPDDDR